MIKQEFSKKPFRHSLLFRLGLAMVLIVTLAFVGMLSSVFIADRSEGQAAAINLSGTLRMMSYRIESQLLIHNNSMQAADQKHLRSLIDDFEKRLTSNLLTAVLPIDATNQSRLSYELVHSKWFSHIRPLLIQYIERSQVQPTDNQKLDYINSNIDHYVNDIDNLVKLLEIDAEDNIQLLRSIQIISLLLTSIVVLFTMYIIKTNLLLPLRDLRHLATNVRQGNFKQRINTYNEDELGELIYAFNLMSEDLSKMYDNLEQRVKEKTWDLERSNRSLELLYNTTRRLSETSSPLMDNAYDELLKDIEKHTGLGTGSICIGEQNDMHAFKLASIMNDNMTQALCHPPNCNRCFGEGCTKIIELTNKHQNKVFSTPIKDSNQQYGVLMVEIPNGVEIESWQQRLIESVASHIAMALNLSNKASENRLISLMEERSVIARELHDSLAQALSYLKIQVSRLNAEIQQDNNSNKVELIIDELRDGLNSAYRQLRELLTTFRLRIDTHNLETAIKETVEEFRCRSDIDIQFTNTIGGCTFKPNAEIHIIQIIRES
ncbi:MAG: type IV pili methyl-accepting chemotaxis transducer N-terminal domain-containing protein, partial [Gammaproteobacteria bacterium]|nr:type IV pili methyl-accepting chemotaxis transducer N-terminal domain-containing protein [Gammaproteobacteria bacterium]